MPRPPRHTHHYENPETRIAHQPYANHLPKGNQVGVPAAGCPMNPFNKHMKRQRQGLAKGLSNDTQPKAVNCMLPVLTPIIFIKSYNMNGVDAGNMKMQAAFMFRHHPSMMTRLLSTSQQPEPASSLPAPLQVQHTCSFQTLTHMLLSYINTYAPFRH